MAGIGATVFPQYEGAKDYEMLPAPGVVGSMGGVSFQLLGSMASLSVGPRLGKHWQLQAGPVLNYGTNRTHLSVITDRRVRALGRIAPAIELGGSIGFTGNGVLTSAYDRLSVSLSYRADIAGAHGGNLLKPSVLYLMPVSHKAMVLLLAQADRADSNYARTYFGITPAQATASGLPGFTPRGGWKDWSLAGAGAVSLGSDLTHGLQLVGGISYTRLLNDFAASPVTSIAGSRHQWMGAAGLAYIF